MPTTNEYHDNLDSVLMTPAEVQAAMADSTTLMTSKDLQNEMDKQFLDEQNRSMLREAIMQVAAEKEQRLALQAQAAVKGCNPKDIIGATKPPMALVPPCLEVYVAMAMKNGAAKYGPYNWRDQKIQVMEYLSAIKRHIADFIDGETNASDSNVHHLAHAAAGCGILLDAFLLGCVVDDRPKPGKTAQLIAENTEQK